jgi:DNA-binding protein H-NS
MKRELKSDLEKLSVVELTEVHEFVGGRIEELKEAGKDTARQKIMAMAAESGHDLKSLGFIDRQSKAAAAKYRDPETGETWSGRGRVPGWIAAAKESGKGLEKFAIEKKGKGK